MFAGMCNLARCFRRFGGVWVLGLGAMTNGVWAGSSTTVPATMPAYQTMALTAVDALAAWEQGHSAAFIAALEAQQRGALVNAKRCDEAALVRLAQARAVVQNFPITTPDSVRQELRTLLKEAPELAGIFLLALTPADDAPASLAVLTHLRRTYPDVVPTALECAVAAAVVWDTPIREGQSAAECQRQAAEIFRHITQKPKGYVTAAQLPWQVALYLMNSRVDAAQRTWAADKQSLPQVWGKVFFDVAYDFSDFKRGAWEGRPYTLENIRKFGGVCKDQAYYAAEVLRAQGVPTALCTGTSWRGEGFHAWVGYFQPAAKAKWDFSSGRYPEHNFWSASIVDPQTGQTITDADVALTAELYGVPRGQRLLSVALAQSVPYAPEPQRAAWAFEALTRSPGNALAWTALVDLCARAEAPPALLNQTATTIERYCVGKYDEFAFRMYVRMIKARPVEEQITSLQRAAALFKTRPDLQAELNLSRADALATAQRHAEAHQLYQSLARTYAQYGPLALRATDRVDAYLRQRGELDLLVKIYAEVWPQMKLPLASGYVATTPWYIMGQHYATVLDEQKQPNRAKQVRSLLVSRQTSPNPPATGPGR